MIALVVTVILLILILLRLPVPFAILGSALVGMLLLGGPSAVVSVFQTIPLSAAGGFSLSAVPLFILMAHLILASGALDSLFASARVLVGRLHGGTGIAAVLAGSGFASVSGSSTASAATLAYTSTSAMLKQGYSERLATGAIASAGTLAAVIPPSVLLIFYAVTAETNVAQTLMAGLVPGVLMAIALMATVYILARRGHAPAGEATSWGEKLRSFGGLVPILVIFLLVVGTVFLGVMTPTESAALGCVGGFVLMVVYRKVSWEALRKAVGGSLTSSAMILSIVVAADVFGHVLAETRVTEAIIATVGALPVAPVLILLGIVLVYLVLGFFMDQMAIIALTVPVTLPLVTELGYDPIWFGVVVILAAEIGLITPPLGLNAFVTARVSRVRLETVFLGSVPFIVAMLVVVALVFAFPAVALLLPEFMSG
jgi:C4-dicarboxylate transporter DctM subunit